MSNPAKTLLWMHLHQCQYLLLPNIQNPFQILHHTHGNVTQSMIGEQKLVHWQDIFFIQALHV